MSSLIVEVCSVDKIEKHPNADKLSIASVKGWNCIVGLNQYKEGDLVVFVPPDSILPNDLIEKYNLTYLRNGGRVGTAKLRGYISQGLILDVPSGNFKVGDDVAKILGITKYEVPEPTFQKQARRVSDKKLNPNFDKYTDIENIKNYNDVFTDEEMVIITEKIHGSNARFANLEIVVDKRQPFLYRIQKFVQRYIFGKTHEFIYGSHNVQLQGDKKKNNFYGEDIWGRVAAKYSMRNIVPKDSIIYGEVYGKGVQDLTYGLEDVDLVVFDIKIKGHYLPWASVVNFCKKNGLKTVPELYIGPYSKECITKYTNGKSVLYPDQIREGCVIKPVAEINHPKIGRKILKSVSPEYLLRKGGTEYK